LGCFFILGFGSRFVVGKKRQIPAKSGKGAGRPVAEDPGDFFSIPGILLPCGRLAAVLSGGLEGFSLS